VSGPAGGPAPADPTVDTAARQRVRNQWPRTDRTTVMNLLMEDLAHERIAQRRREADDMRLVRAARNARRDKRSTARAALRVRVRGLAGR
jgi:hypothetical protein